MDKKIKDLDGKEIDMTIGTVISNILGTEKQSDPMRAYLIALEIRQGGEVKESDKEFVKEAVKKSESFLPIAVGQALIALDEKKTK